MHTTIILPEIDEAEDEPVSNEVLKRLGWMLVWKLDHEIPDFVPTRYDLLGAYVHGRFMYTY